MILLTKIEARMLQWLVNTGDVLLLGSQACMSAASSKVVAGVSCSALGGL